MFSRHAAATLLFCLALGFQTFGVRADGVASSSAGPAATSVQQLFDEKNLVAWCIVPFDKLQRTPHQRAQMLANLGFERFAYDWRAQHLPDFENELAELNSYGISLQACWFPTSLNEDARTILDVLKRHKIRTELWVTSADRLPKSNDPAAKLKAAVDAMRPVVAAAREVGCRVGLYNHGGWGGEPENMLAIAEALQQDRVGIVYNFHHGHDQVDRLATFLPRLKPYLLAVNLNGMARDGVAKGQQILPIGQGDQDLALLRVLCNAGYDGPIGILGHTQDDAEARLRDNLDGLAWLVPQLTGAPAGPRPQPRTLSAAGAPPSTRPATEPQKSDGWAVERAEDRARLAPYYVVPAARQEALTPAQPLSPDAFKGWPRSHGDAGSRRFSAQTQIDRSNVSRLEVAWTYHSKDGTGNIQCNPIFAGGKLFAPTVGGFVVAIDGASGQELWRFKPLSGRPAHRGLIFWNGQIANENAAAGRVLFTADQYLYALDPATGRPIAGFGKDGRIELPGTSVVAPAIFGRTIVVPGFLRDVWAYDLVTGEQRWVFHTVPHEDEWAFETWDKPAEGANCWGGMALDEVRGIAYLTTGSPKPNFLGMQHRGQNLFANCVIAIDVRSGKRLWHFQEIPHDIWDLDIPSPPNLLTIDRDGKRVDVVSAVTKIGNTLLLDRVTGEPIFPFRMKRAPVSTVPGELTWPYQPAVQWPQPFTRQAFTPADVTNRSDEARDFINGQLASGRFGWFLPVAEGKRLIYFGTHGGAEWTGAAVDPFRGRLYVSANEVPWTTALFQLDEPKEDKKAAPTAGRKVYETNCMVCHGPDRMGVGVAPPLKGLRSRLKDADVSQLLQTGRGLMPANTALSETDRKALFDYLFVRDRPAQNRDARPERPEYAQTPFVRFLDHEGYPASKPPWGTLNCLDLNTGRLMWKVPLGEHEELTRQGVPLTGTENFGGATATAGGLVFCGGTRDSKIRAFDADSGRELWSARLPWGGYAPPAVYEAGGREFVVIAATGGGKLGGPMGDAYVAFALPRP